jgi:hypothetical protein
MLETFILVVWTTYSGVKISTTAQFASHEACENALAELKDRGFKDGVCLSNVTGR